VLPRPAVLALDRYRGHMRTWSDLSAPVTWEDPDPMTALEALLVFGGGTLGVVTLIVLLVMAPSVARGHGRRSSSDPWAEPLWFNGPTGALDADATAGLRELEQPAGRTPEPSGGGAGARW